MKNLPSCTSFCIYTLFNDIYIDVSLQNRFLVIIPVILFYIQNKSINGTTPPPPPENKTQNKKQKIKQNTKPTYKVSYFFYLNIWLFIWIRGIFPPISTG